MNKFRYEKTGPYGKKTHAFERMVYPPETWGTVCGVGDFVDEGYFRGSPFHEANCKNCLQYVQKSSSTERK